MSVRVHCRDAAGIVSSWGHEWASISNTMEEQGERRRRRGRGKTKTTEDEKKVDLYEAIADPQWIPDGLSVVLVDALRSANNHTHILYLVRLAIVLVPLFSPALLLSCIFPSSPRPSLVRFSPSAETFFFPGEKP